MQALYYPAFNQLEVTDRPVPVLAPDEVLINVDSCGICGSELETFKAQSVRRTPPLIMGHEFCGTIAAVGDAVTGWQTGQKVVSNSLVPCGTCVRCQRGDTHLCKDRQIFGMHRHGAFAEYVNVPARSLIHWPDQLPGEMACLAEPLGNGVHVVELVRHINPEKALIIGAGPIGLMCQQTLQVMLGAETVVSDLSAERTQIASSLGAKFVFTPSSGGDLLQEIMAWTDGEGVDVVVDAVGSSFTKKQSLDCLRPGGAAVWIGLHGNEIALNSYEITLPEKFIYGTYAAKMEDLQVAVDLMAAGKIETMSWVKTWPLSQSIEAFNRMLAAQGNDIKAVIQPGR